MLILQNKNSSLIVLLKGESSVYCCQESRTGSMRGIQENAKLLQAGLVRIRGWAYSQGEVA